MKKKLLVLGIVVLSLLRPLSIAADELVDMAQKMYPNDHVQAYNRPRSSLVIDANTGDVLWRDNVDEVRDPASMSKLMTLYLLFESMKEGKITKDTVVTATAADQSMSKIYEIPTITSCRSGLYGSGIDHYDRRSFIQCSDHYAGQSHVQQ